MELFLGEWASQTLPQDVTECFRVGGPQGTFLGRVGERASQTLSHDATECIRVGGSQETFPGRVGESDTPPRCHGMF